MRKLRVRKRHTTIKLERQNKYTDGEKVINVHAKEFSDKELFGIL